MTVLIHRSDEMSILITCETSGSQTPAGFDELGIPLLRGDENAGYSARLLAAELGCQCIEHACSPGWIDVSRSLRNRELFAPAVRALDPDLRSRLINSVYLPYRQRVRKAIKHQIAKQSWCIHISVRTFDLVAAGRYRRADAGIAYDTNCPLEVQFCAHWVDDMFAELEMLKVRRNYPRRGTTDNLPRALREEFGSSGYLGFELQLNRAWVGRDVAIRPQVISGIADSLAYFAGDLNASAA